MSTEIIEAYEALYPKFPWKKFREANRAVNWELWNGPLPSEYWTKVEPLEAYKWEGYQKGLDDIEEMLGDLPSTMYWDTDFDCLMETDPYDEESNWEESNDPDFEGEMTYFGPIEYYKIDTAKELPHDEVWKMI